MALAVTVVCVRAGTPSTGSGRLVSVESNRYDYWRVAVATFAEHPLRGIGTGSFRVEWLLRRDRDESVRDAHSLYLETAAELGLVGPRRARRALRRGDRRRRARARLPAATAALAAWAVHAGLDWDWEMPALTLVRRAAGGAGDRGRGARGRHGRDPPAAADAPTRTSSPPPPPP